MPFLGLFCGFGGWWVGLGEAGLLGEIGCGVVVLW